MTRMRVGVMGRWTAVGAGVVLYALVVGAFFSGCVAAGSGTAHVLYILTNRSGGEITYEIEFNGTAAASGSLAASATQTLLDDCAQLNELRMRMVCSSGGTDCNNLGIIIDPSEVQCGDVIDVYIDPAVGGQLQLSAYRRNHDGTSGETTSSNDSSSGSSTSSTTTTSTSG